MKFFRQTKEARRKLSFFVALAMVISLLPVSPVAKAAGKVKAGYIINNANEIGIDNITVTSNATGNAIYSFKTLAGKVVSEGSITISVASPAAAEGVNNGEEVTPAAINEFEKIEVVTKGENCTVKRNDNGTYDCKPVPDVSKFSISVNNISSNISITVSGKLQLKSAQSNPTSTTTGSTIKPSEEPSSTPGTKPSGTPGTKPSGTPGTKPGGSSGNGYIPGPGNTNPSAAPSAVPSSAPSDAPGTNPSNAPGVNPSNVPGTNPSNAPGTEPTNAPGEPTKAPGTEPTNAPSDPTKKPSTSNSVKVGKKATVGGSQYKVTAVKGTRTVQFTKGKKNAKTVKIPSTVKISGKSYKVTVVAKNALKGNKKLTKLTIGANIKKIGANAFKGCSKLKNVTIKTKKLTKSKVGNNAFKGINAKATIKVPKAKVKAYKKIVQAKGAGKSVKVKK